jgi:hypothetical protein
MDGFNKKWFLLQESLSLIAHIYVRYFFFLIVTLTNPHLLCQLKLRLSVFCRHFVASERASIYCAISNWFIIIWYFNYSYSFIFWSVKAFLRLSPFPWAFVTIIRVFLTVRWPFMIVITHLHRYHAGSFVKERS